VKGAGGIEWAQQQQQKTSGFSGNRNWNWCNMTGRVVIALLALLGIASLGSVDGE